MDNSAFIRFPNTFELVPWMGIYMLESAIISSFLIFAYPSSRNSRPLVHYPLHSNMLLQYIKQINLNFSEESVTFNTLRGLRDRGVKVELGFPDEMWETPDAEVTRLKSRVYIFILDAFSVILILWL